MPLNIRSGTGINLNVTFNNCHLIIVVVGAGKWQYSIHSLLVGGGSGGHRYDEEVLLST